MEAGNVVDYLLQVPDADRVSLVGGFGQHLSYNALNLQAAVARYRTRS